MKHGSNNLKKEEAFFLRKQKKSYREIAELLNVSKGTISYWFKDIDWSKDIQEQLTVKSKKISSKRLEHLNLLKKEKYKDLYEQAEKEAIKEFVKLKTNQLFVAGISIYWGEGDRVFKNGSVRVSNSDSRMLVVFRKFLLEICDIDIRKLKGYILIYPDHFPEECLGFWSKSVGVDIQQFYKPTVIQGKHKSNKLSHGVCTIGVNNKFLKKKILTWINLIAEELN